MVRETISVIGWCVGHEIMNVRLLGTSFWKIHVEANGYKPLDNCFF